MESLANAPTFDPLGLEILAGLDLTEGHRQELAVSAEAMLGLSGRSLSGRGADVARLAVAHQVAFLVRHGSALSVDPPAGVFASFARGKHSFQYTALAALGVSPVARRLATEALSTGVGHIPIRNLR